MVSDINFDSRLSRFTLAIFQDSGMFEANPRDGQQLDGTFQKGCQIFDRIIQRTLGPSVHRFRFGSRKTNSSNHYNDESQIKKSNVDYIEKERECSIEHKLTCSGDFSAILNCKSDAYSNFRSFKRPILNCKQDYFGKTSKLINQLNARSKFDEEILISFGTGKNSECVSFRDKSGIATAGCFEIKCEPDKSKYFVIFNRLISSYIECSRNEIDQLINKDGYQVLCQDPELMCKERFTHCKNDCSLRGKCTESGKCDCNYFYFGEYCEKEVEVPESYQAIWDQIKKVNGLN
jgi:hypothetical protein